MGSKCSNTRSRGRDDRRARGRRQVIDRRNPNRYKVASYGPDGVIMLPQPGPLTQRRSQPLHVDSTNYIVRGGAIHQTGAVAAADGQALVENSIGIMHAKSDQQMTVEEGQDGRRRYIIEIPRSLPKNPLRPGHLRRRACHQRKDFRIQEFRGHGLVLKQPFSISVKLRNARYSGGVTASFEIEPAQKRGPRRRKRRDPLTELMTTVLRELGAARGRCLFAEPGEGGR